MKIYILGHHNGAEICIKIFGLYSILAESVVFAQAYIYKIRYQGIYIILTTVGRREQYMQ
jgi:hypothetical protein